MYVRGQCGFFKRKQREQLIRKKRESTRYLAPKDDADVTGNDDDTGNDVIDERRDVHVEGDDVEQDRHSVYDNDDVDAP